MKKLKIKQKSNRSGFTLVELVIVIAIVIILSVISVPIYRSHIDKAKYSEGYALLGTILSAQKAYYSEYGNFYFHSSDGYTAYNSILGIDARGNKYFTRFGVRGLDNSIKYSFYANAQCPEEFQDKGLYLKLVYDMKTGVNYYQGA